MADFVDIGQCYDSLPTLDDYREMSLDGSLVSEPRGLVGYWPLNGTAQDFSGHGNHGTLTGTGSPWVTTDRGRVWDGNGTDRYVKVSPTPVVTDSMTVSAWIYLDQTQSLHGIIETAAAGATREGTPYFLLQDGSGNYNTYCVSGGYKTIVAAGISARRWFQVVVSRSGGWEWGYLDGVLKATNNRGGSNGDNAQFNIGVGYNRFFDGKVAEVMVHDHAIDAATVREIYDTTKRQFYRGPTFFLPIGDVSAAFGGWNRIIGGGVI